MNLAGDKGAETNDARLNVPSTSPPANTHPSWAQMLGLLARLSVSASRQATEVEDLRQQIDTSSRRAADHLAVIETLERTLASERAAREHVSTRHEIVRVKAAELQGRLQEVEAALQSHRGHLALVQSSTSWKLTRPWRAYRRFVSRRSQNRPLQRQLKGHFASGWYLNCYPDVRLSEIDPLVHFLIFGAEERRDPSPSFSTDWYLKHNPDVAVTGMNPLLHFVSWGLGEGRDPHPDVSNQDYARWMQRAGARGSQTDPGPPGAAR